MLVAALVSLTLATFRPDHAVSLGVVAPWSPVPLLDLLVCHLVDSSNGKAIDFLKAALSGDREEEALWSLATILSPDTVPLMKAEVSVGVHIPRIEMFREMARSVGGSDYNKVIVTARKKPDLPFEFEFHEAKSIVFDFDISVGHKGPIVYADLSDEETSKAVLKLMESGASYVLRPTSRGKGVGVPLRGYGIEMRPFKYSMEYGVKDTIILDAGDKAADIERDESVADIDGIPVCYTEVNQVQNFAGRVASWMRAQKQKLPRVLRDLTANFPLHMAEIAGTDLDSMATQGLSRLLAVQTPQEVTVLNGKYVNLKRMDSFTLLDTIKKELNVISLLQESGLDPKRAMDVVLSAQGLSTDFMIDFEHPSVVFLNNIERDAEYRDWTDSVDEMTQMMMYSLPQARKNLLTAVVTMNPMTVQSCIPLLHLLYMLENGLPLRVGVVPVFPLGNRLSRKVAYAFHHIARKSSRDAVLFLVEVQRTMIERKKNKFDDETLWAESYARFRKSRVSWNDLHKLYDPSSPESQAIEEVEKYVQKLGISKGMVTLNGKICEMEGQEGLQELSYEIQRGLGHIVDLIVRSRVRRLSEIRIKDLLSSVAPMVPTFNTQILSSSIGFGLLGRPLAVMRKTVEALSTLTMSKSESSEATVFYVMYSDDPLEIKAYKQFMNTEHRVPSEFALNPPEKLVKTGKAALIANGRMYQGADFTDPSVYLLVEAIAQQTRVMMPGASAAAHRLLNTIAVEAANDTTFARDWNDEVFKSSNPLIYVSDNNAPITWDLVVDPFTRSFQRIAEMVRYVDDLGLVKVRMAVLPTNNPAETGPITTTYYRSALTKDNAVFTMLNDTTTYSVMTDMPETWVTESMRASVDLDNILLQELAPATHVGKYILTNVMSQGLCSTADNEYAEGSELEIVDSRDQRVSDTIVMMSNGYWQMPANPGVWKVQLGGARTKRIYDMKGTKLAVHSFAQSVEHLYVSVRPGMEGMKVYNISHTDARNTSRVDVFSVASGHLYERLLKIMMLAVRRQSEYNVKFWIIKAFLSPQFKATLPIMAAKYNFTYELVAYKWPFWLRQQQEKQRIIWGNKILFLDVLFPLDLERVIYIDSDQIVRTDLIELMRMDFGNAPYAFTPFCESREETEGFRFWKDGYWKEHLQGKKYHISALFAIDLRRFRQMAAGDWLRYCYQQLSADPGSLSNLDQDLPNYAQHHIPIYSLPQNWLWCETWCSDETMDKAKTIDLCNNPLTKAPKLHIAQTRIAEWPGLDEEVRNVTAAPDAYERFFFPDHQPN